MFSQQKQVTNPYENPENFTAQERTDLLFRYYDHSSMNKNDYRNNIDVDFINNFSNYSLKFIEAGICPEQTDKNNNNLIIKSAISFSNHIYNNCQSLEILSNDEKSLVGDHIRELHTLVEAGCKINHQNNDGDTTLYIEAGLYVHKTVNTLLSLGANPDIKNNKHQWPLLNALKKSDSYHEFKTWDPYYLKHTLSELASVTDPSLTDDNNQTMFYKVLKSLDFPKTYAWECWVQILEEGLFKHDRFYQGINTPCGENAETPALYCARSGDLTLLNFLERHGADLNIPARDGSTISSILLNANAKTTPSNAQIDFALKRATPDVRAAWEKASQNLIEAQRELEKIANKAKAPALTAM
jgi:hypothetical protein